MFKYFYSSLLLRFVFTASCILMFSTCQKDHLFDCFTSTGKTIVQHREAGVFSNIDLKNSIDLIIYPDTTPFIQVEAGEHLIDGIITELDGNTLYIRNENKCNWVRSFENKYIVRIGMRDPEHISYYGSGEIRCMDTIRTREFTFDSWNGSGSIYLLFHCEKTHINNSAGRTDIHARGISGVSYVYIHDTAMLDASELESGYTFIRNSSTGDCHVYVSKEIEAEIIYSGSIYYSGSPYRVVKSGEGSGKLVHEQ
jgi:hypothetical protein